jgi:hypothetical protein
MGEIRPEEREGGWPGALSLGRVAGRGTSREGGVGVSAVVPAPPRADETRGEAGLTAGRGGSPGRAPCHEVLPGEVGASVRVNVAAGGVGGAGGGVGASVRGGVAAGAGLGGAGGGGGTSVRGGVAAGGVGGAGGGGGTSVRGGVAAGAGVGGAGGGVGASVRGGVAAGAGLGGAGGGGGTSVRGGVAGAGLGGAGGGGGTSVRGGVAGAGLGGAGGGDRTSVRGGAAGTGLGGGGGGGGTSVRGGAARSGLGGGGACPVLEGLLNQSVRAGSSAWASGFAGGGGGGGEAERSPDGLGRAAEVRREGRRLRVSKLSSSSLLSAFLTEDVGSIGAFFPRMSMPRVPPAVLARSNFMSPARDWMRGAGSSVGGGGVGGRGSSPSVSSGIPNPASSSSIRSVVDSKRSWGSADMHRATAVSNQIGRLGSSERSPGICGRAAPGLDTVPGAGRFPVNR